MRSSVCALAVVAVVAMAGCGGTPSSGDASQAKDGGASAPGAVDRAVKGVEEEATTRPARPHVRGGSKEKAKTQYQLPQGVPLETRSARVRKAIDDLLHPDRKSEPGGGSGRGRGGGVGILEQLRRAVHERIQQPHGKDRTRSGHDDGSGILDMLR
jgi:hypothetical protein